jgi:hypothetical protein
MKTLKILFIKMETENIEEPEPTKVTKKEKSPGRVAAGKKLAERNRQKKLEKLKESQIPEIPDRVEQSKEKETNISESLNFYYLGLVPVGFCVAYKLYKVYKSKTKINTKIVNDPVVETKGNLFEMQ